MARIERVTPSEAKRKLASVLHTVEYGQRPVILERHGREIAALIPIELYALVRELLQELEDEDDWKEIQQALADPENKALLEWEPDRYGKAVQDPDPAQGRQKPAARSRASSAPGARPHRRPRH